MDFMSTVKGSMLEGFYPAGWDFNKIDECCSHSPEEIMERQDFWHPDFQPVCCENVSEFDMLMGHEIANEIKNARDAGKKIALILPVGPMGMYKWAVYFLKDWNVCRLLSRLRLQHGRVERRRRQHPRFQQPRFLHLCNDRRFLRQAQQDRSRKSAQLCNKG